MARLFRSLRKTLTLALTHQLHHQQQRLCICSHHPSRRTYISDMRKAAFEGNISRLLRDEIHNAQNSSSFCTLAKKNNNNNKKNNIIIDDERYLQLENLDMMTAAKILFTDPPKKKKFGFDFHLVQFFFACLPSFAVYLVAQYARYEMRKMEVEVEQKRKQKEEEEAKEKEKEMELNPLEEKEAKSDPQLSEVKERLEKLEEAVKDIVGVTKNQSSSNLDKNQATDDEKKPLNSSAPRDTSSSSASNKAVEVDSIGQHNSHKSKPELGEESKGSVATPNSSLQDQKGQNQSGRAS